MEHTDVQLVFLAPRTRRQLSVRRTVLVEADGGESFLDGAVAVGDFSRGHNFVLSHAIGSCASSWKWLFYSRSCS